jgi:2-polyprenyl-3-methyl-5-hydroxy-6-metoxy-1,4-benzoquinol methylase
MLELSVYYAQILVPQGTFYAADLTTSLDIEPNQFDTAILVEVYEHIPPEACPTVLANLYRLLQSGGKLIISTPTTLLPPSKLHYRHFERQELEQELMAAGFRIQKIIRQHRLDKITAWLTGNQMNRLLYNGWLQPTILKRLRRSMYMYYANEVGPNLPYGRLIVVADRQ